MGFGEICALASKETIRSFVDVNDARFLAPENMTAEVKSACEEAGEQIPQTIGELAAVIYHSLAKYYAKTAEEIEKLTGIDYSRIQIVGGGANAHYLNELTAEYAGKRICGADRGNSSRKLCCTDDRGGRTKRPKGSKGMYCRVV